MLFSQSILQLLGLVSCVACHGHVRYIVLNNATYTAFLPIPTPDFKRDPPSIMRNIGGDGPVQDISSTALTCNFNATPIRDGPVSRTGPVEAGSNVTFIWPAGWPHSGPILTYMARCKPNCGNFTGSSGSVWFKIDQMGYENDWATQSLFDQENKWSSRIPKCLAAGEYLIRHEIIALSGCKSAGSCQFYPSCAQVKVMGKGKVIPSTGLASFPGNYTFETTRWDTNTQDPRNYTLPGPPIFTC